MIFNTKNLKIEVDFTKRAITSLCICGKERLFGECPLFTVYLRDKDGKPSILTAWDAGKVTKEVNGAIFEDFSDLKLSVRLSLTENNGDAEWRISVTPGDDSKFVEWVEFASVTLPSLVENNDKGDGGRILFPYNEGALISNVNDREESFFRYTEPSYPSMGSYTIFPNMVFSQFIAYLFEDSGLYIGAEDEKRGVKDINYQPEADGIKLRIRHYCGTDFGESYNSDYPLVFSVTEGGWESAAERYRKWFESALPSNLKKISENSSIPEWYEESPLIVSYPIRGSFDMDEMKPNSLYPYTNALPIIEKIRDAADSRLLVLLMHWEGTAPWAPPYVWPPYGDADNFASFLSELHKAGDMLGVYCSGFGYTIQSNLIADYNRQKEYDEKGLSRGMCAGPDGKVAVSHICTAQRSGYDVCPASAVGKELLLEAYKPLLESDIDYVQILDQNHGGGQYFCYSRDHGHAPAPGAWMTENMQNMLGEWNEIAGKTLLGCESAAAEPFIGNLLFSDNRYQLNYTLGTAVPLYAYIYHEYARNFMGNQVCCPFVRSTDTLRYRLAYSFAAGDSMTVVLTPDGDFMPDWGTRDFSCLPDKERGLSFIRNLTVFYKESAKPYLSSGRMIAKPAVECDSVSFMRMEPKRPVSLPSVLSSAWEAGGGSRALILVNPSEKEEVCTVLGRSVSVPPMDAVLLPLD